ncbi:hypothetical protein HY993_00770, partial [Candidatus Micrarchaeota archaeon]|nr:hypothetical protein [Candidatus Micrarchaeota archaeon]
MVELTALKGHEPKLSIQKKLRGNFLFLGFFTGLLVEIAFFFSDASDETRFLILLDLLALFAIAIYLSYKYFARSIIDNVLKLHQATLQIDS